MSKVNQAVSELCQLCKNLAFTTLQPLLCVNMRNSKTNERSLFFLLYIHCGT